MASDALNIHLVEGAAQKFYVWLRLFCFIVTLSSMNIACVAEG